MCACGQLALRKNPSWADVFPHTSECAKGYGDHRNMHCAPSVQFHVRNNASKWLFSQLWDRSQDVILISLFYRSKFKKSFLDIIGLFFC